MNFVLRTTPTQLTQAVPLDLTLEVYFMIDINIDTITPHNLLLLNVDEQNHEPISFEYRNKVLLITPTSKLKPLAHYQMELVGGKDGLKDITGRLLEQSYMFEFYAADIQEIKPPVITAPTDMSSIPSPVTFKWNEANQAYFYELEISRSNTFDVLIWPQGDSRVYETQITPEVKYEEGTYYARIRTINHQGDKSAYAGLIQFHVHAVTSQSAQAELDRLKEQLGTQKQGAVSLGVVASKPADQEVNVPISFETTNTPLSEVVVEFEEDLDLSTISAKNFYVIAQKN